MSHYVLAISPHDAVFFGPFDSNVEAATFARNQSNSGDFYPMNEDEMLTNTKQYGEIPIQTPNQVEE